MWAASVYFAFFVLSSESPAGTLRFDSGHRPHRAQIRAVAVDRSGEAVDVREDPSSTSETVDGLGDIFIAGAGNNQVVKWAPGASEGVVVAGTAGQGSATNPQTQCVCRVLESLKPSFRSCFFTSIFWGGVRVR